jgi:hypothetical protein
MSKKTCRRFFLAALMLLMTTSLLIFGPAQRAAGPEECEECMAACEAWYESCVATGGTNCLQGRLRCEIDLCLMQVCLSE